MSTASASGQFSRLADGGRYGPRELSSRAESIRCVPLPPLSGWYGGNRRPDSPFIGGKTGGVNRGGNVAVRLENWFAAAEDKDSGDGGGGNTGRGTIDEDAVFTG